MDNNLRDEINNIINEFKLDYDNSNKNNYESLKIEGYQMYFNEINKFPLLTEKEQFKYGKMLQFPENKRLLSYKNVDGYSVYCLNTDLLFNSLINCENYEEIINYLLELFQILYSNNNSTEEILLKYRKLTNDLGRSLNKEELLINFGINTDEEISMNELYQEVKSFILYKYAFDKMYVSNLRLVVSIASKYKCNK